MNRHERKAMIWRTLATHPEGPSPRGLSRCCLQESTA